MTSIAYHPSAEAQLSHELRIPLTGILGTANFLDQTQLDSQQKYYLHAIQAAAKRLLGLENKLYSALKTQRKIPFSTRNIAVFAHHLEQTQLNNEQKEYVQIMVTSADRLSGLKQKFIAFLRPSNALPA